MSLRKISTSDGTTKWEVRLYENGRGSKKIKRTFDRKVDAEEFMFEFKKEIKNRSSYSFNTVRLNERTFREEAEYWLKDGNLRFSNSHLIRVKGAIKELLPQVGEWTLDRFTPEMLSRYQQQEKSKGLANGTVNRKTEVITAILNFSLKHRRIPFNPSVGFRKLRRDTKEMLFWSQEEAQGFLGFVSREYPRGSEKRWVYVVYLLALNSALRAGEIWGLKPSDISPDGKSLHIRRQFERTILDFSPPKGKKARFVPCPPVLLEELKNEIFARNISREETIFQNKKGRPVCHDNFSDRQFQEDIEKWGGRRIRFHDLRHTATTLLISRGVDIKTVKEVCGHADIATTMNYVHMVAGAVEKLADIFSITPGFETKTEEVNGSKLMLVK